MGIKDRLEGPSGLADSKATLDRWSHHAHDHSEQGTRARAEGPMVSHGGEGVEPYTRGGNARATALSDKNHRGSGDYCPGIRRQA